MELPFRGRAAVPLRKVTAYLLDTDHPDGGAKAKFFLACGYTREKPDVLADALKAHCMRCHVANARESRFGITYALDGPLDTPDGSRPAVRTVWFLEPNADRPVFETAYPKRR